MTETRDLTESEITEIHRLIDADQTTMIPAWQSASLCHMARRGARADQLVSRLRKQPHEPPCVNGYRAGTDCICWIGRAVEFVLLDALTGAGEASEDDTDPTPAPDPNPHDECRITPLASRARCSRGTNGCMVDHGNTALTGAGKATP